MGIEHLEFAETTAVFIALKNQGITIHKREKQHHGKSKRCGVTELDPKHQETSQKKLRYNDEWGQKGKTGKAVAHDGFCKGRRVAGLGDGGKHKQKPDEKTIWIYPFHFDMKKGGGVM